jgi:2-polyprenyl-3-methyl-5-hydroxy-6-metoxy-1,4-benzoquinol methylase
VEHLNYLSHCPVCEHTEFNNHLSLNDWMITKEAFTIVSCSNCGFHFTNPIPKEDVIGSYYKSEDYVSHSSTNKGLVNRIYTVVRNYTLAKKVSLVRSFTSGNSVLDIGAGTGHFLATCKQSGFSVQGLEPDLDAKNFAKSNFNIDLESLDVLSTIPSSSKDCITMWHVLEHVYHLKRDLNDIVRVLNDTGVLFVAVPNMGSYDAKKYREYWAAYDVPRHLYHFEEATITNLLSQFDMKCVSVLPMKFDSYYVSMLSEKYKGGSIVKAFLTGFVSNLKASKFGYSSQIYVFKKI